MAVKPGTQRQAGRGGGPTTSKNPAVFLVSDAERAANQIKRNIKRSDARRHCGDLIGLK